jgi:hypothetical protein
MIGLLDRSRGGWLMVGTLSVCIVTILDGVAFIGGIRGVIVARQLPGRAGIARSVVAIVMGLLGFVGAAALLMLTSLATV